MSQVSSNEQLKTLVKRISKVKFGGGDTKKLIQSLYDKMNEMVDSVNKQTGHVRSIASGKVGDIRVRKKGGTSQTNEYMLEVKTDKGWASVQVTLNED